MNTLIHGDTQTSASLALRPVHSSVPLSLFWGLVVDRVGLWCRGRVLLPHLDRLVSRGFQRLAGMLFGILTTPVINAAFTDLVVFDDDQVFSLAREVLLEER